MYTPIFREDAKSAKKSDHNNPSRWLAGNWSILALKANSYIAPILCEIKLFSMDLFY